MQAIVAQSYGSPDVLQLQEAAKPIPKANEVLIKIHASTVTMGDCEMRRFDFPVPPIFWLPLRLYFGFTKPRINIYGQELSGEIEAVGQEVTQYKPGDQVFAPTDMALGAHAEYKCLPVTAAIAIKPANMSYVEAAAVPVGGLNAVYFLRQGNIQPGEKVLINGAGGSIGTYAVQLAKFYGADVTAVDSAAKLSMLRTIGADHVIDYTQEDFTQRGATYDVIFDVVAKSTFSRCEHTLNPNGRYLSANPKFSEMLQGIWVARTSNKRLITGAANYAQRDLDFLKELIEAGKLTAVIDRTYSLAQTAAAHRYVESGQKAGCVGISVIG